MISLLFAFSLDVWCWSSSFSSTLVFGESSCFIESGDEVGVLESIESLLLISIVSLSGIVIAGIELSLDSIVVGLSSKLSLLITITGGSGVDWSTIFPCSCSSSSCCCNLLIESLSKW